MKLLDYSSHARDSIVEREIDPEWVQRAVENPMKTEADREDPELTHYLARIPENGNRVLRVVLNDTRIPALVVSTFFDRRMKKKL
jgi:hypothetical protein